MVSNCDYGYYGEWMTKYHIPYTDDKACHCSRSYYEKFRPNKCLFICDCDSWCKTKCHCIDSNYAGGGCRDKVCRLVGTNRPMCVGQGEQGERQARNNFTCNNLNPNRTIHSYDQCNCFNGGKMTENGCKCNDGYTGFLCQDQKAVTRSASSLASALALASASASASASTSASASGLPSYAIALIACGSSMLIVTICIILRVCFGWKWKGKRRRRGMTGLIAGIALMNELEPADMAPNPSFGPPMPEQSAPTNDPIVPTVTTTEEASKPESHSSVQSTSSKSEPSGGGSNQKNPLQRHGC